MFAVEENIPINRKFFQFSTFSKIPKFYSSGPVSVPIFRRNGECGNFPIGKFSTLATFLKKEGVKKSGGKKMGVKKKGGKKKVG